MGRSYLDDCEEAKEIPNASNQNMSFNFRTRFLRTEDMAILPCSPYRLTNHKVQEFLWFLSGVQKNDSSKKSKNSRSSKTYSANSKPNKDKTKTLKKLKDKKKKKSLSKKTDDKMDIVKLLLTLISKF
ncbi:hypothetical protein RclHR1_29830001 [Rhizophagus clarus]|uniref:Uncharacterized protein n=1 Tax=Rhizophagus clarus TaxID=94130 RepID=A0A2Z6RZ38_9GLOM|nr:hypothetical protein RclHR1_29830001 [Rhizophagus clarus]